MKPWRLELWRLWIVWRPDRPSEWSAHRTRWHVQRGDWIRTTYGFHVRAGRWVIAWLANGHPHIRAFAFDHFEAAL